eukprot:6196166-Pleurochrysis_carterae.AAC.1
MTSPWNEASMRDDTRVRVRACACVRAGMLARVRARACVRVLSARRDQAQRLAPVSYTHLRAHETDSYR